MNKTALMTLMAASFVASGATAQTTQDPADSIKVSSAILAVISSLEDQKVIDWVQFADLDGDGDPEAVIMTNIGPDAATPDFREWRVIDDVAGMGAQVGTWYGTNVEVIATKPDLKGDPEVSIVRSDGAFWYLFKGKVRPFGDLVSKRTEFIHPGKVGLEEDLFADFGMRDVPVRYMARITLDITPDPADEVLVSLMGEGFWRESDGATPYILMTSTGEEIYSGWSFTHPSIFLLEDGGFQLIEAVNNSYRAVYFHGSYSE
jgi:hypothetical protein